MEIILALIMLLLSNAGAMEDVSLQYLQAAAAELKTSETETPRTDENVGTDEWIKRDPQAGEAPVIRGIFATAHSAGGSKLNALLQLIDDTELNAIVIDVKDDHGNITYETGNAELESFGTTRKIIRDIDSLMNTLEQHEVYPIARIVVFKDTVLAKQKPEWSFLESNGSVWINNRKEAFVNPYVKEVWDYNIEVAKEAVKAGFKEIQFDYVRFPEGFETRADRLKYSTLENYDREDIVTEFVKYAREQLNPLGVRVSVDIFGYAASAPASGIGQDFNGISKYVDVISPMIYPSHYGPGWFGSPVPDAAPYTTIYGAAVDTHKKLEEIDQYKPIVRPWIQDFTASWIPGYIPYGKEEVEAQIRALKDTGIKEFLLWNASNVYTEGVNYTLE